MIVGDDVSVATLRERGLSDQDIRQVRAFAAFLRLPNDEEGKTLCPPSFYDYAKGGDPPPDEEVARVLGETG